MFIYFFDWNEEGFASESKRAYWKQSTWVREKIKGTTTGQEKTREMLVQSLWRTQFAAALSSQIRIISLTLRHHQWSKHVIPDAFWRIGEKQMHAAIFGLAAEGTVLPQQDPAWIRGQDQGGKASQFSTFEQTGQLSSRPTQILLFATW